MTQHKKIDRKNSIFYVSETSMSKPFAFRLITCGIENKKLSDNESF